MTVHQIGINAAAIRSAAARLESAGFTGDAITFCEALVLDAIGAGYKPLERPVPKQGPGSSPEVRAQARAATQAAIDRAKRARTQRVPAGSGTLRSEAHT